MIYKKTLDDNIYKEWIRLIIDFGELVKVVLKKGSGTRGGWVREEIWGLLGFVALVYVWVYFCCCIGGCLCQDLQESGVVYSCTVG
jgi:hypothetical protein